MMFRSTLFLVMSLCALSTLLTSPIMAQIPANQLTADEVVVDVSPNVPTASVRGINITFTSQSPGNLFLLGQPADVIAHVSNTGPTQDAEISVMVSSGSGCRVYTSTKTESLQNNATVDVPISLGSSLPCGSYLVEVLIRGLLAYNSTRVNIWRGPLDKQSTLFGISYAGPLNTERTIADLDLFKQAGFGWIRFPLQGWLPQGEAAPANTQIYDKFVRDVADRNFDILAAFAPQVTVDPSVNRAQTEKDYYESLLAAATRYAYKIKHWELLTVKPPSFPAGMKGISYGQLAVGREALRHFDKSLHVTFPLDDPITANALELFFYKLPWKGDDIGFHYDYLGIPENQKPIPKPPLFELSNITDSAKKSIKETPKVMASEYGWDREKNLPHAAHQAALIARTVLLNFSSGFERTIWRHDPDDQIALPFTCRDGSAQPSLLAMRTTLSEINDVSAVSEVKTSIPNTHIFLLCHGSKKKHLTYSLVAWSEVETSRTAIGIKTDAVQLTVKDLWGNSIDLQPTQNMAIVQVDEYPRFIELGKSGKPEIREIGSTLNYTSNYKIVGPGRDTIAKFNIQNSQFLFTGSLAGELRFHAWPVGSDVITKKFSLAPYAGDVIPIPLKIPEGAYNGKEVYEINTEIFVGDRRIGYLTLPVFYSTSENTGDKL